MPSQFFGLNIAYTGLQAANVSLNTTANNISNVETEGYSRQNTVQQASDALHTWTSYGMAGAGVDTIAINQTRDQYYDLKFWTNNANAGTFEIKQYYMEQLEDYFTETDMKEGFGTIYADMFHALEEVYKSAGDDTVKTQYLAEAQSLCDYFGAMYSTLQKVQLDANSEIKNKVDEINSVASQIATLNKQINTIEITGTRANELRDQRALLVDELSKIVDVKITETPIYVSEDSKVPSGIYKYSVLPESRSSTSPMQTDFTRSNGPTSWSSTFTAETSAANSKVSWKCATETTKSISTAQTFPVTLRQPVFGPTATATTRS